MIDYDNFNGKKIILTTVKNSKYFGLLLIKKNDKKRILLKNMVILNKDGTTKATSGIPEKRFFNRNSIKNIEEEILKEV